MYVHLSIAASCLPARPGLGTCIFSFWEIIIYSLYKISFYVSSRLFYMYYGEILYTLDSKLYICCVV